MSRRPGRRPTRQRAARGRSVVGRRFTAVVGPVAHGGHCVVRLPPPESRVVFTRHALPGETVVVEITEGTEGDRFWRGDAVEVVVPSPDRVAAPCPASGPGRCGGCDFQHVALAAQRALKAGVVREQLIRLGDLAPEHPLVAGLVVEEVPGDHEGLRWRTRVEYVALPGGRHGMRKHRSHDVIEVDDCLITAPGARVLTDRDPARPAVVEIVETGAGTHRFDVAADGFWQVHPGAPRVLVETVLAQLTPRPGERVLDLYAGVGLFARFLADAVGDPALVTLVEASPAACEHASSNVPGARIQQGPVDRVLERLDCPPADLVVLDPPRQGARRRVVEQVVSCAPRAVAYVACDPAALARDVATFAEHGYRLQALRAFDLFPMTHHVECVALLEKNGSDLRWSGPR